MGNRAIRWPPSFTAEEIPKRCFEGAGSHCINLGPKHAQETKTVLLQAVQGTSDDRHGLACVITPFGTGW